MKIHPSAALLAASLGALVPCSTMHAQTTPAPMTRPPVHRVRHAVVHKLPVCPPGQPAPVVPAGVPAVAGPVETAFSLRYIDVAPGTGAEAQPGDYLTVHYTGWLAANGTKFDSSVDRGTPFTFGQGLHRVIPGWDQGFGGMRVGGKRRLFIPYQMAYGDEGRPPVIPPKSDLIFDIELLAASSTPPGEVPEPPPANGAPQK